MRERDKMSIIASIQTWLSEYEGMELRPMNEVLTDLVKPVPTSYALASAGDSVTTEDIAGNRTYTKNYVFYARESVFEEKERAMNHDFLEGLTEWIESRADNDDFPQLSGGYEVDSISVSNLLLYDVGEDGMGVYQVQIKVEITKRRVR